MSIVSNKSGSSVYKTIHRIGVTIGFYNHGEGPY